MPKASAKCNTCGATFSSKEKLAAHMKKAHAGKPGMMKTV
ncbi:MAG TPA: C2H2-type zinc finger protein [Nitrososphaerales archaeon]|nr:C2H2-type zinc finger protein [Nitrososphaerales archaeon]